MMKIEQVQRVGYVEFWHVPRPEGLTQYIVLRDEWKGFARRHIFEIEVID